MILKQVISGGQTGADRGGLIAARAAGIPTGGWMPRGFRALDGNHPEFADLYGMKEHAERSYRPRTAQNVFDSDGTIIFAADWWSAGTVLTLSFISKNHMRTDRSHQANRLIDVFDLPLPSKIAEWVDFYKIRVLNIAGNSEDSHPGIQGIVARYLLRVFEELRHPSGLCTPGD